MIHGLVPMERIYTYTHKRQVQKYIDAYFNFGGDRQKASTAIAAVLHRRRNLCLVSSRDERGAALYKFRFVMPLLAVTGCADYMNNRDTITLGAGNASEANLAMQTVDPFPAHARNTNIEADPAKVGQAYHRYLVGPEKDGGGGACDYPGQVAADGSICGGRAADVRPGGKDPGAPGPG